jgi:hypothetical protein
MKLFIALGGELHQFATKKLQIATPKQDKLLVWLSEKTSHSDHGFAIDLCFYLP